MKDTCSNALATKEFVVNIMSQWYVEAANHTCGNYDAGVNEFEVSGLTPLPSEVVCFRTLCTHASHASMPASSVALLHDPTVPCFCLHPKRK